MLTAIELENFKGFAARQRIELAPITLLFGANNAGKSTILQALLYLRELLVHGGADVDRTGLGGQVVELGGFARLVHRHERSRPITIRAEFTTPRTLERFGRLDDELAFPDLDDATDSAWIELTVRERESASFGGPIVDRVVVGVGTEREPLVWIETGHSLRDGEALNVRVNMGHPALGEDARDVATRWEDIALSEEILRRAAAAEGSGSGHGAGDGAGTGDGWGFGDGRPLPVFAISRARMSALPPMSEPISVVPPEETGPEAGQAAVEVRMFLEMVVLGTVAQLAALLDEALYIGPLRTIPPRGFLYERRGRAASWADGLAAWDLLLADRTTLVDETNTWLARLGAGCKVVVQDLYSPAASAEATAEGQVADTVRRLLLGAGNPSFVLPSEVGAGISQMIPVIVAALARRVSPLIAIEQPEIHVHPALQVGLGDLLIEASAGRAFLIETHSEHLILRLMRRIRETHLNADAARARTELAEKSRGRSKVARSGARGARTAKLTDTSRSHLAFTPERLSVIYVEPHDDGVRITRLRVGEDGQFQDLWPRGFFDERFPELYGPTE